MSTRAVTVTVTPPGPDLLPWDTALCRRGNGRSHVHNGRRGCRVIPEIARAWIHTAEERWQTLHVASLAESETAADQVDVLAQVWEPRPRGVPDLHLVLAYELAEQIETADRFIAGLTLNAPAHGFGFVRVRRPRCPHATRGLLDRAHRRQGPRPASQPALPAGTHFPATPGRGPREHSTATVGGQPA